jgi:hypothetical protein
VRPTAPEAEAWSIRLEGYGGPAQPSPTIGQCLNGGPGWLEVECNRCKTRASLPVGAIRRPRDTPIWKFGTNRRRTSLLCPGVGQMTFGYVRPFSFKIVAPPAIKVASVRHGVTEITLSDGRLVRATLHIKDVKPSAQKPGSLNISYNVVAEVMATPSVPILDVHETVQ